MCANDYIRFSIKYFTRAALITFGLVFCCVSLCGCEEKHEAYVSDSAEIRDNTPLCLVPEASGITVYENELASIDISNSSEGYFMATYTGDCEIIKVQVMGPDNMPYTYDLAPKVTETFPLSAGDGTYTINILEQIEGNQYAAALCATEEVTVSNTLGAFLYPNQYVKFDKDKQVVALGKEVVANAHDDLEAIGLVYNYLISNITYDTEKAENIQSGYVPDVDEIINLKTGICLDYSAVMCSILRSQQIPCRMEVGYAGTAYHAWISTYVKNIGWINGMVEFDGQNWSLMDPTVAANSGEEALKNFIGDGGSYMTKYIY